MDLFKSPSLLLLVFALLLPLFAKPAPSTTANPFFSQKWGADFNLLVTENGETLSIGAVSASGREIFIYDLASGAIVVVDSSGKVSSKVKLDGLGRGTYFGDDFAALDSMFIFVNSVDKRLEYFNRFSGKHLSAGPFPSGALLSQKRAYRIINRIFVIEKKIFIGNEHVIFDCEKGLKKTATASDFMAAPASGRFGLVSGKTRWILSGKSLTETQSGKKAALPQSHFSISGKRLFVFNNKLFSIQASADGVSIIELN